MGTASAARGHCLRRTHPDRVAGLVLVRAERFRTIKRKGHGAIEADFDNAMKPYWDKLLTGAKPGVREKIEHEMNTISKEASLRIIRAAFEFDPLPSLQRYPGPKLVLYTASGDTPNDLQNLMPGVPHRRIESTSHWMHMDEPEEFNQMLDAFLRHPQQRRVTPRPNLLRRLDDHANLAACASRAIIAMHRARKSAWGQAQLASGMRVRLRRSCA